MATPPRHFFRVADSILREPWSRDEKLTMVLLCAWLNQRAIRDRLRGDAACRAVLSPAALAEITGRTQLAHARRALSALCARVSIATQVRGEFTEIYWPKFADFQGLTSRVRAVAGQEHAPSGSDSDSDSYHSPPKPPAGGLDPEGRNRSPRRMLRERARAAGVEDAALDRAVQALEHCADLTPGELRYVARGREAIAAMLERLLAERPKRLTPVPDAPADAEIHPRLRGLVDRLAERPA